MGGYGSGRYAWGGAKPATDHALALDVRWLARQGYLPASGEFRAGLVSWSRRGEVFANIGWRSDGREPDVLVLEFRARKPGEAWRDVEQRVALDRTACAYGGTRPWFLCPRCGARCAVLWSLAGYFCCRGCNGLAYSSTRESAAERCLRRADTLQKRLGNPRPSSAWDWPPKPKGMHRRTYDRLIAEISEQEEAADLEFALTAAKMCDRLDRLLGKEARSARSRRRRAA
jgi:hypothetical protein